MKKVLLLGFIIILSLTSNASAPMVLNDSVQSLQFLGIYLDVLEDPIGELTFNDITGKAATNFSTCKPGKIVGNANTSSTYWIRMTVENQCLHKKDWVIELYDYKIDYYEIYLPDESGQYSKFTGGYSFPFDHREYKHKNFLHDLYQISGGPKTIYYKIKSDKRIVLFGVIRTVQKFVDYSTTEYYLLSLFYGIILAMIFYNLFLFISTFDIAYFYYVLYVTSIGTLALTKDGLGFEYFWPNHPSWNNSIPSISGFLLIVWALIYARTFLETKKNLPLFDKGILIMLLLRTILFISSLFYPVIASNTWLDMIPLVYIYALGIISWVNGYRMARFYVLAFTLFFSGFSVTILNDFQIIHSHPLVVYGFNIGVLCEMLLLSLALADRIKILTTDKEAAQREIIVKSKENESLKDKLNSELERRVQERTRALEEKNKELDTFIYRSSHDIKGPLKSIIGLTTVGMHDVEDYVAKNYFEHILKSSRKLDTVVDHLVKVMETKEATLNVTEIKFQTLIQGVYSSLNDLPCFCEIKKEFDIDQINPFYSDEHLLGSILHNLFENAIKYIDKNKSDPSLKIRIQVSEEEALLEITDNGIGIESKHHEKIFDMLYKLNPESQESGMGLYMTRMYVEKLGGSMVLRSEVGQGTTFTLRLRNLLPVVEAVN